MKILWSVVCCMFLYQLLGAGKMYLIKTGEGSEESGAAFNTGADYGGTV